MKSIFLSGCGVLTGVLAASTVYAQDNNITDTTVESSERYIVVTAQKREQRLQDVPLAIQAFSGEGLEKQGVKSASDVLLQVPSASFASPTPTAKILQMRGISQNASVDPSVAVYVDEIPMGFPGAPTTPNIEALDLERIEVLRGPQGTLYGLGAMGGTMRVLTAEPSFSDGLGGRVFAEGGMTKGGDDSYAAGLALNVPLIDDVLAGRVSVSYRRNGGWIDDTGRGQNNVNRDHVFSLRGKLLFTPTDRLKIKLTAWRNEVDTHWSNQAFFKNSTERTATGAATDPAAYGNTHFTILSGFVSYDLGFASLENGLSYYNSKIPARFVIGTPPPPDGLGLLMVDTFDHSRAWTNELRLVSQGDTPFQWIIGTFYRDVKRDNFQEGGFEFFPDFIPPTNARINSESVSFFGEASYGFADDKIRVLVGARYFHDKRRYLESTPDPLTGAPTITTDVNPKFNSFNPRFNITFKPNDGMMFYFNAAKGFRSGIINTTAQTAAAALDGINGIQIVQPDSIWTYEIGSKLTLADRTLFLEGALFYSDWKDFQLGGASSSGFGFNTNGGDARIKGVEAALTWYTPLDGLSITANGSYNDAEFHRVSTLVANASPLFHRRSRLPTVPRWSGSVSFSFETPIGGSGLEFVSGGSYIFRDGQTDASGNVSAIDGLEIITDQRSELSLRAGIRKDAWELTAFVNNLTNNLKSVASLTATQWYSPIPRTFGLRLSGGF